MGSLLSRRTFVTGACLSLAATALGCTGKAESGAEWSWERDDDLPVLYIEASNGSGPTEFGDAWLPQDGWVQLQLSTGSAPFREVESMSQEGSTLVVRLRKKDESGFATADIFLTEYRLSGGDAASIESVVVEDKGKRIEIQRALDSE